MFRASSVVGASLLLGSFAVAGCGAEGVDAEANPEDVGEIVAELKQVPSGVQCVRVVLSNGPKTVLFSVSAGSSTATLSLGKLPLGQTSVVATAFNAACGTVTSSSVPDWVGDSVWVDVQPGIASTLNVVLAPYQSSTVGVDFLQPAAGLEAGGNNTYLIAANGSVRAAGSGLYGGLGDGLTSTARRPTLGNAPLLTSVAQISAQELHACAVGTNGSLRCWGTNSSGQLGDGTTVNRPSPVTVISSGVAKVAIGYTHTCVLMTDGTVRCTGSNQFGQVGNANSGVNALNFVQVETEAIDLDAGAFHTCAVSTRGRVSCWGYNAYGQLGVGSAGGQANWPYDLDFWFAGVVEVAAGGYHTCARKADSSIWCWGYNDYGQVGDGTTVTRTVPVAVNFPGVRMALGLTFSCALYSTSGPVYCWGDNEYGQVGDGSAANRLYPWPVRNSDKVIDIKAGTTHACARLDTGEVACWGQNGSGQLGLGSYTDGFVPAMLPL